MTDATHAEKTEPAKGGMMPAPTEHHQRMKPFEGTFRAEVKMWMGPGDPMVSSGTMVNTLELGGLFLAQHYTGDPSDGPFSSFEGRGFWGYNTALGEYEGVWIDSASTVMQTDTGAVDAAGTTWTMRGKAPHPQGEGTIVKKSVIALQDDDHHTLTAYFEMPQGEMRCMEIAYTRAG